MTERNPSTHQRTETKLSSASGELRADPTQDRQTDDTTDNDATTAMDTSADQAGDAYPTAAAMLSDADLDQDRQHR